MSVDGQPLVSQLDGQAIPLDAGSHAFHFEAADGTSLDQRILIPEGEQNHAIAVVLGAPTAPRAPATAQPTLADHAETPAPGGSKTRRVLGFVTGGVGVGLLGLAAYCQLTALSRDHDSDNAAASADPNVQATAHTIHQQALQSPDVRPRLRQRRGCRRGDGRRPPADVRVERPAAAGAHRADCGPAGRRRGGRTPAHRQLVRNMTMTSMLRLVALASFAGCCCAATVGACVGPDPTLAAHDASAGTDALEDRTATDAASEASPFEAASEGAVSEDAASEEGSSPCAADAGAVDGCPGACEPDASLCVDGGVESCGAGGQWSAPVACPAGSACAGGVCKSCGVSPSYFSMDAGTIYCTQAPDAGPLYCTTGQECCLGGSNGGGQFAPQVLRELRHGVPQRGRRGGREPRPHRVRPDLGLCGERQDVDGLLPAGRDAVARLHLSQVHRWYGHRLRGRGRRRRDPVRGGGVPGLLLQRGLPALGAHLQRGQVEALRGSVFCQ